MILLNTPYEHTIKVNAIDTITKTITHTKFYTINWHREINKFSLVFQDGYMNNNSFVAVKSRTLDVSSNDYNLINTKGDANKNILDDIVERIELAVASDIGGTII